MKKSAILMIIIVYVIAFFAVGLLGLQIRANFNVDYLNEIKVEEFVLPSDQPKLKLRSYKQVALNEEQDVPDDRKRFQNAYEFETIVPYDASMVLKFNINLVPENTTFNDYKLWPNNAKSYVVEKQPDGKIFIKNIEKKAGRLGKAEFTVEDLQNHQITTEVIVYIK